MGHRSQILGWEAVGRLDTGSGFCTATLIEADLVLTAAHCLYNQVGLPIAAGKMRFRAGFHGDSAVAERGISNWVVSTGYRDGGSTELDGRMIANDVALLRLDRGISSSDADPFRVHDAPAPGGRVSVLSYGEGREQVMSREADCAIAGRYNDGVLAFDCNVTFGSSGAPVLVRTGARMRILSIISALGHSRDGRRVAFGMQLPHQVAALKARLRVEEARPRISRGAKRLGPGERGGTGARFVRP